jgi:hypothetical protein
MTCSNSNGDESTGVSVYNRDKQINEIQQKIEENRRIILEKRSLLKAYAKTNPNPDIKEIVKKYDEYFQEYKTNIKLQVTALEEIIKHLDNVLKEQDQNEDELDSDEFVVSRNKSQIKKDKRIIMKEIENLRKLLL